MGLPINYHKHINKRYSRFLHPVKAGSLTIPGNIFLAPMAGYTDSPFRVICLEKGAFFTFTEMVSAEACLRKSKKTFKLIERSKEESIVGVQVFGSQPQRIALALKKINKYSPSLIDLNCGCSIPKILKSGSGAALLRDPDKIFEIIKAMKQETDIPVSLKIRSGWDMNHLNYLEVGYKAEEAGASLITLHPRTRTSLFSGKADLNHIKILKQKIGIPVIGSGDLFTPEAVYEMLNKTKCDGVMIARGAIGNPFIFTQVLHLLTNGVYEKTVMIRQRLDCAFSQLQKSILIKGESKACMEMRKHFCAYTKGLPGSAVLREEIVRAKIMSDYEKLINSYILRLEEPC